MLLPLLRHLSLVNCPKLTPPASLLYKVAQYLYHSIKILYQFFEYRSRGVRFFWYRNPRPGWYSQFAQDYVLCKLNLVKPASYIVDVGCNHPVYHSNTFYLERILDCKVLAFDGQDFSREYFERRPLAKFTHCLVDDSASSLVLNVVRDVEGWENQISSIGDSVISGRGLDFRKATVPAYPLSVLCEGIPQIDLLCVDVEGHELRVLNSLDYITLRPTVILIENNGRHFPRSRLELFLVGKGYKQVARIVDSDDVYVDSQIYTDSGLLASAKRCEAV